MEYWIRILFSNGLQMVKDKIFNLKIKCLKCYSNEEFEINENVIEYIEKYINQHIESCGPTSFRICATTIETEDLE